MYDPKQKIDVAMKQTLPPKPLKTDWTAQNYRWISIRVNNPN